MLKSTIIRNAVTVIAAVACFTWSSSATAGIAGIVTDAVIIAPPVSVFAGTLEDDNLTRIFGEGESIITGAAVTLDQTAPGAYFGNTPSAGAVIPAGELVRSYFLHFDAVGTPAAIMSSAGSVTFENDILGIIYTVANLDGSDFLSTTGTLYPTGLDATRGGEALDLYVISPDSRTLDFLLTTTTGIDHIRVITRAPEPSTYALLGVFLVAAAFGKRRQLKKAN